MQRTPLVFEAVTKEECTVPESIRRLVAHKAKLTVNDLPQRLSLFLFPLDYEKFVLNTQSIIIAPYRPQIHACEPVPAGDLQ